MGDGPQHLTHCRQFLSLHELTFGIDPFGDVPDARQGQLLIAQGKDLEIDRGRKLRAVGAAERPPEKLLLPRA